MQNLLPAAKVQKAYDAWLASPARQALADELNQPVEHIDAYLCAGLNQKRKYRTTPVPNQPKPAKLPFTDSEVAGKINRPKAEYTNSGSNYGYRNFKSLLNQQQ